MRHMRWLFYYNFLNGNNSSNNKNYNNINEGLAEFSNFIIILGIIFFILFALAWLYFGIVCLKDYILEQYKNNKPKKYISQDELLEKINKWKNEKNKEQEND